MRAVKRVLVGAMAIAAVSVPGLAFAQFAFPPSSVVIVMPDGKMTVTPVNKKAWAAGMEQAKPVTAPVMLMTDHGQLYLVPDMMVKMAGGERMIDYFSRLYTNPGG